MDQVKVVDAGAQLMLSGPSRALVEAALETLAARGAQVLSPPAQLGSRWIATCGKPASGDGAVGGTPRRASMTPCFAGSRSPTPATT